jgi:hypothetical protein
MWIDAICINQDDIRERGHQVQQMGDIYSQAERVLFWLGQSTEFTTIVIDSLTQLHQHTIGFNWALSDKRWAENWEKVQSHLKGECFSLQDRQRRGLEDILGRPWFHRVWILQEVSEARAALVYCGMKSVSTRVFALAPLLIGVTPDAHCQAVLDLMPGPARKSSWWGQERDLYTLLHKFSNAQAQDERDNIYALIGMCTDRGVGGALVADYEKSTVEVIKDTISDMCLEGNRFEGVLFSNISEFLSSLETLHDKLLQLLLSSLQMSGVRILLRCQQKYLKPRM